MCYIFFASVNLPSSVLKGTHIKNIYLTVCKCSCHFHSSLPELLEKKRIIDMHTTIATALLEHIKVRANSKGGKQHCDHLRHLISPSHFLNCL